MKSYFEIYTRHLFIWLIVSLIVGAVFSHLSRNGFDWSLFFHYVVIGIVPIFFVYTLGKPK